MFNDIGEQGGGGKFSFKKLLGLDDGLTDDERQQERIDKANVAREKADEKQRIKDQAKLESDQTKLDRANRKRELADEKQREANERAEQKRQNESDRANRKRELADEKQRAKAQTQEDALALKNARVERDRLIAGEKQRDREAALAQKQAEEEYARNSMTIEDWNALPFWKKWGKTPPSSNY